MYNISKAIQFYYIVPLFHSRKKLHAMWLGIVVINYRHPSRAALLLLPLACHRRGACAADSRPALRLACVATAVEREIQQRRDGGAHVQQADQEGQRGRAVAARPVVPVGASRSRGRGANCAIGIRWVRPQSCTNRTIGIRWVRPQSCTNRTIGIRWVRPWPCAVGAAARGCGGAASGGAQCRGRRTSRRGGAAL
jgi:hypothetical protein